MITLIHGQAELLRAEALEAIRATIADDPTMIDLNQTQFDGRSASIAEIRNACDTMPFLAARRLVIVVGLLRRLSSSARGRGRSSASGESADDEDDAQEENRAPGAGKIEAEALIAYLPLVPDSCDLVIMEDDLVRGGAILRRLMELQRTGGSRIVVCQNPRKYDLPGWIRERAKSHKVQLDGAALVDLAEFVGEDLRLLDQELIKLADYTMGKRVVTRADVRRLVPATRAANVFEMVDALGLADGPKAGRLLQHALDVDAEPPLRILGMISRQYRLLIMAKSLRAQGAKPNEIAKEINVPEWTAPRLLEQASRHSFVRLQSAMELILATDESIKTGKLGDREAMDLLLAGLVAL